MIKINYDGNTNQFLLIRDLTNGEAILRSKLIYFISSNGINTIIHPGDEVVIDNKKGVVISNESKEKGL